MGISVNALRNTRSTGTTCAHPHGSRLPSDGTKQAGPRRTQALMPVVLVSEN